MWHEMSYAVLHQHRRLLAALAMRNVEWLGEGLAVWFGEKYWRFVHATIAEPGEWRKQFRATLGEEFGRAAAAYSESVAANGLPLAAADNGFGAGE